MLKSKDRAVINEAYLDRAMKILYSGTNDLKILWQKVVSKDGTEVRSEDVIGDMLDNQIEVIPEDGSAIVKITADEIEDSYGNLEKIVDKKNTVTIAKKGNFKILSLDNSNFSVAIGNFEDEGYILFNKKMKINKKVISRRIGSNTFKRYIVEKVGNETFCAVYISRGDKFELIYFKRYDKDCDIDLEVSNTELINMSDEALKQYAEKILVSKYNEKIVDRTVPEIAEPSEDDDEKQNDLEYDQDDSWSENNTSEPIIEEDDDLDEVPHYENAIFLPDDMFSFDYLAVENRLPMVPLEDEIGTDRDEDFNTDVLISEDTYREIYEYASRFKIIEHGTELDDCEKVDIITSLDDTIEVENEYLLALIGYSGQVNYEYDIRVDDVNNELEEAKKQNPDNQDPSDDGENR